MLHQDLIRHRMEFARAIDNHKYEVTPSGIAFPQMRAFVQGVFDTEINGSDQQIDPNTVPVEALNYLLKAGIKASGALGGWFIAPFLNDTVPATTLTAATFESTLNEWTAYDEPARQAWTVPADPTNGSFDNTVSPAVFTANAEATIIGAGILSASGKEATAGKVLCASKFAAGRVLQIGDTLGVKYTLSAVSTG